MGLDSKIGNGGLATATMSSPPRLDRVVQSGEPDNPVQMKPPERSSTSRKVAQLLKRHNWSLAEAGGGSFVADGASQLWGRALRVRRPAPDVERTMLSGVREGLVDGGWGPATAVLRLRRLCAGNAPMVFFQTVVVLLGGR